MNFNKICWYLVLKEWNIEEQKLSNLLYYSQSLHLAYFGKQLFPYSLFKTETGFEVRGEAKQILSTVLNTRDYIHRYLALGYYFIGFLEYLHHRQP